MTQLKGHTFFPLTNYLATFPDIIPNLKRQLSQTLRFHQFFSTFLNLIRRTGWKGKVSEANPKHSVPTPYPPSQVFLYWLSTIE